MSLGPPRDGRHTFQRLDANPRWRGHPRPRRGRPARHHGVPPDLRAGDGRPRALLAGQRPERGAQAAHDLVLRARRRDWSRSTSRAPRRTSCGRTSTRLMAATPSDAVRFLPGHDQWVIGPGHQGHPRHPAVAAGPDDPQGQPGDRRRRRVRDLGAQGRRPHRVLARRPTCSHEAIEQETDRLAGLLDADLRLSVTIANNS